TSRIATAANCRTFRRDAISACSATCRRPTPGPWWRTSSSARKACAKPATNGESHDRKQERPAAADTRCGVGGDRAALRRRCGVLGRLQLDARDDEHREVLHLLPRDGGERLQG